jgi:hypothetical protein
MLRKCRATRLRELSNLVFAKGEKTPWATTVRSGRRILKVAPARWTFLGHPDVEPTNNAAVGEAFSAGHNVHPPGSHPGSIHS